MAEKKKTDIKKNAAGERPSKAGGSRGVVSLAIIPDGNRRWARKRLLPAAAGHLEGANNFKRIVRAASDRGIRYITFYAFSTENWKRSEQEVSALMKIFSDFMEEYINGPDDGGRKVRIRVIGERGDLPERLLSDIVKIEKMTENNDGITANVCISYGSRDEIAGSVRKLCKKCAEGELAPEDVTEDMISEGLFAPDTPDPDLVVRTSGELRLSNFLLWQSAYSELYFADCYWPDFDEKELDRALDEFAGRKRRYGA